MINFLRSKIDFKASRRAVTTGSNGVIVGVNSAGGIIRQDDKMKKIKLMPDYGCFPIWGMEDDNFGNIDPYSLPISKSLAEELLEWANKYDKTLNIEEPLNSGFENIEKENIFKYEGEKLFKKLKLELGDQYTVIYPSKQHPERNLK